MEQKLLCIPEKIGEVNNHHLDKYLEAGWHVAQISAAGNSLNSCCWILIERATDSKQINS
jgi:hypothetical protein